LFCRVAISFKKKYLSTRFFPGSSQLRCILLPLLLSSPFCSDPTVLSYHSCPVFPVSIFLNNFYTPLDCHNCLP
jgi:hypothetical protein